MQCIESRHNTEKIAWKKGVESRSSGRKPRMPYFPLSSCCTVLYVWGESQHKPKSFNICVEKKHSCKRIRYQKQDWFETNLYSFPWNEFYCPPHSEIWSAVLVFMFQQKGVDVESAHNVIWILEPWKNLKKFYNRLLLFLFVCCSMGQERWEKQNVEKGEWK